MQKRFRDIFCSLRSLNDGLGSNDGDGLAGDTFGHGVCSKVHTSSEDRRREGSAGVLLVDVPALAKREDGRVPSSCCVFFAKWSRLN